MKITTYGVIAGLGWGSIGYIDNHFIQIAAVLIATWAFGTASYEEQQIRKKL